MDEKKLRECFGLFATGITIASTNFENKSYGMTINSFASVSLNPALLLFSIANSSSNLGAFLKNSNFIINVLSKEQLELAKEFSRPQNDKKWQNEEFHLTKLGNVIFEKSLGFFECQTHQTIEAGDHHIIIGQVINLEKLRQASPLLYFGSEFS